MQDGSKKSRPAFAAETLQSRNPLAAHTDNDGNKNHQYEDHQHGITGDELKNRIKPTEYRRKNGGNVRNESGKSTSSRRRQHSPFLKNQLKIYGK